MLKQLMLSKKIAAARAILDGFTKEGEVFATRSEGLESAIAEATTDEEVAVVEEDINKLGADKAELEEKKSKLEGEIKDLESELAELKANEPATKTEKTAVEETKCREDFNMSRYKFFGGMTREAAESLIEREDVKDFLVRTKELMVQKRSVTGAELAIPEVMLDLLRDNLHNYSKLIKHINLKPVAGKARQTVAGSIPEAIWMEACGKLNELALTFSQIEVDGYKVGGFIPICNATLEDSDINLTSEILTMLGQALGLGIDKAILYGTGVKMPVGIVTRLAATTSPAYWGSNEKTFTDLHSTNLLVAASTSTDVAFYQDLIKKLGVVKANYATGGKFWAMSETTFANLQAKALGFSANGAIVSGQTMTMPVIGGDIEFLDFIPANHIIGGYGSLYLLAERKGATLAQSEHVQFIEDNTVFKGTARYDGRPVFGESFVGVNILSSGSAPAASDVSFAADSANP